MLTILYKYPNLDRTELRAFDDQLSLALYLSYLEARKGGKRRTYDEHNFEVKLFANLESLRQDILNKTYLPLRSTAHIITHPVIREIFAATFRDRVVHHFLFGSVYDWWDRHFIYDSYSCRIDKGTLFGIMRLDHHIRSVSQDYTRPVYILKMDIKGYFMSLPRKELYRQAIWGLDQQFKGRTDTREYEILKFLWRVTIMDDPVKGARKKGSPSDWSKLPPSKSLFTQPKGIGIVIGNLTSQLLSNIYLDKLDRFITQQLGYKHYGRYVDDFFIVVDESQLHQLKRDIRAIEEYLKLIGLTAHPTKRSLRNSKYGVSFLGATIKHGRIIPGERLLKSARQAFYQVTAGERDITSVPSYLGHFKHFNSYNIIKEFFDKVGWDYLEDDAFRTNHQKTKKSRSTDDFSWLFE
ncbi:MAG: RNA-directed DNA polymerase [Candidatus Saccharibacteria bacterium]|nr:RNA-directed DNA polymerase [Candidatus Saccharibacteria bacterium]